MVPAFVSCGPRQPSLLQLPLSPPRSCNSPNKPDWIARLNFPVFITLFCHQIFICSEGTLLSVSPETLSPKKLHDLSKAPCQGARSEEVTCPVYNPVSHTGDSHTAHFVSRNNLAAFQHRACPCCRAPCAVPNYDVASISTLFSPGETGDLATAVLCCPCPPAGVQGMLAKGKQQDSCL